MLKKGLSQIICDSFVVLTVYFYKRTVVKKELKSSVGIKNIINNCKR